MRDVIAIREDIITDKNITSIDYRVYTYLLSLEKEETIDIGRIADELNSSKKQVIKSIVRLAELDYMADLECLN